MKIEFRDGIPSFSCGCAGGKELVQVEVEIVDELVTKTTDMVRCHCNKVWRLHYRAEHMVGEQWREQWAWEQVDDQCLRHGRLLDRSVSL